MKQFMLLFLVVLTCHLVAQAQPGHEFYAKGNELYKQGKFLEATRAYTQALDSLPADSLLTEALKPEAAKIYNNRGNANYEMGQYLLALFDYDKVLRLLPEDGDAYLNRGNAYTHVYDYTKAEKDFNKAIALQPTNASAYYNRGLMYFLYLKQFPKTIEDMKKCTQLMPDLADAHHYLGAALFKTGKLQEAIAPLTKAISLDDAYADPYYYRAEVYYALKNKAKALADINKAISLQPGTPEYEALQKKIGEMKP